MDRAHRSAALQEPIMNEEPSGAYGLGAFVVTFISAPMALWLWWMNLPDWHWSLKVPAALFLGFCTGRLFAWALMLPIMLVAAIHGAIIRWRTPQTIPAISLKPIP
jgi:hypothetical protein